MLERVDALATVHRQLYESEDIARFDIGSFAASLVNEVVGASGRTNIDLQIDAQPLFIDAAHASALGLILNEIVTNALKHAYGDGRAGYLQVLVEADDARGIIKICDDGPGLPSTKRTKSIGTALITRLARQAHAEAIWNNNSPGTCVTITFPRSEIST
ncbi:MAG: sensor histidine kinase, partial [Verrucomicrobiaceae bacterium]